MSSSPRSPSEHYTAAERLIAAAPETPESALLLAVAHALLCAAPRRARKRQDPPSRHSGSPQSRWLFGGDEDGQR